MGEQSGIRVGRFDGRPGRRVHGARLLALAVLLMALLLGALALGTTAGPVGAPDVVIAPGQNFAPGDVGRSQGAVTRT
jgi:hypothetical protein